MNVMAMSLEGPHKLTNEELHQVLTSSNGKLTDWQCRCLVHYMLGWMRHATNIETTRQEYFRQVKAATEGKSVPVI